MKNNKKLKVYYAHFMGIYNTPQEERDVKTLEDLGFEVLNPNTPETQEECNTAFSLVREEMTEEEKYHLAFAEVFFTKIDECEIFAFRAIPDGRIPGGVAKELKYAKEQNKLIIELPCGTFSRSMGKEDTREYLRDIGQR